MAKVTPAHWQAMEAIGAAQRELETLDLLARELPDDYTIFHGIHWTRVEHGCSHFGEIDFAIVSPGGRLLVIEQKSGFLDETGEELVKRYGNTEKKVALQFNRNIHGLQSCFSANGPEKLGVDLLTIKLPSQIEAEILEASAQEHLSKSEIVRRTLETLRQRKTADIMAMLGADNVATVPELESALDAEVNSRRARLHP